MNVDVTNSGKLRGPLFAACLGIVVFVVRALTSGPAFFADGPAHLAAIANHTYVIQPPGYWLFNRIGGLFPNPEHGILLLNWTFSALGCMALYACARRLVPTPLAELGALLYATAFFAWFSGNVHSTYASQLLFPPFLFYMMLRYREDKRTMWVVAIAVTYALGAGFRPSDGAFMAPLLLLFFFQLTRKQQFLLASIVVVLCLAWLIPAQIAQRRYHPDTSAAELGRVATQTLMGKFNIYTISNALRYFLPLTVALGPALLYLFGARKGEPMRLWLWVWVIPGSLFFLLIFISDAPYLNCLLGGFILLCLLGMAASQNRRLATAVLTCSILINLAFYLGFRALPVRSAVYAIVEKDLGNYTLYAVKHQFFVKRLTFKS
jgi:hypothetical protein